MKQLDQWQRLERFLSFGADSTTNDLVRRCWEDDSDRTLMVIGGMSNKTNQRAILALSIGAMHPTLAIRNMAFSGVNRVCRTADQLLSFIAHVLETTGQKDLRRKLIRVINTWRETQSRYQIIDDASPMKPEWWAGCHKS
jgi:hypothetical protein